jgi:hypothetical protein
MKSFGKKNPCIGLKSAILSIFQKLAAALQNCPQDLYFLFYILFFVYVFKYEIIVRSSASSFGHSDPDPRSVSPNPTTNSETTKSKFTKFLSKTT